MSEDRPTYAGLDVGGTKIGLAIGRVDGVVLARDRMPTNGDTDPTTTLTRAASRLEELATDCGARPSALGVACPGPFDPRAGQFLEVPNMVGWQGFGIVDRLRELTPWPVAAMNDADASALAECAWGAARGAHISVFITMSTGCGAGIVVDGRPLHGAGGFAGEIGHIRLADHGPVGFGKIGSVEGFLSGPGMVQLAQAEALRCRQAGDRTALNDEDITAERLCQLAESGDRAARSVTDVCAQKLGELCAILVDVLNPDVIALGTIGAAHPDLFLGGARAVVDAEALSRSAAHVRIVASQLPARGDQSALAVAHRLTGNSS